MEKANLTPKEFFESEWYKDGVRQLCFDGWPGFVVPVNIQVKNLIEQNDQLLSKMEEKERECELIKIRLNRTKDAAYHALLEMSAWLGIPDKKRMKYIDEHMSNVTFCADNNVSGDDAALSASGGNDE